MTGGKRGDSSRMAARGFTGLGDIVDDKASYALLHHFEDRPAAKRYHRRAGGHRSIITRPNGSSH